MNDTIHTLPLLPQFPKYSYLATQGERENQTQLGKLCITTVIIYLNNYQENRDMILANIAISIDTHAALGSNYR
jgi:hypothetical protein